MSFQVPCNTHITRRLSTTFTTAHFSFFFLFFIFQLWINKTHGMLLRKKKKDVKRYLFIRAGDAVTCTWFEYFDVVASILKYHSQLNYFICNFISMQKCFPFSCCQIFQISKQFSCNIYLFCSLTFVRKLTLTAKKK